MMQRRFPLAVRFTAMPREKRESISAQSNRIDAILAVCCLGENVDVES